MEYGYSSYGKMVTMKTYRSGTSWNASSWPGGAESPDTTTWQYDAASGQMTNKLYADSSSVGYSYTVDGKLSTRTWARSSGGSHVTTYSYDSDTGELTGIDYSDLTPDIAFTYNRMGQQSAVSDAVGGRGFAYNSEFQLESETITNTLSGLTHTLTRSYSDTGYLGRDIGFSLDSDYGIGYEFDAYGRLNAVTGSVGVASALRADYSYLANSDLVTQMSNSYGQVWTRSYESDRNLITSIENTFGTNIISRYAYGNDPLARRTNRIDTGSAISAGATNVFGYNDRSELTSALMTSNGYAYSYDPIGNRESATNNTDGTLSYTANELNQYTEITNGSGRNLSYDPDGSLTNDGYWCYTWNCENRLIQVEPITPTNDAKKIEFVYDYMGRRSRKIVSEYTNSAWSVVSTNHYLYDSWNMIQEVGRTVTGEPSTNLYVFGLDLNGTLQGAGGIGGLLVTVLGGDPEPVEGFPLFDANGNVCQYADTNGTVVASREYSAYGETISSSGAMADDFTFWFSTKYWDSETGLGYWGRRYYHPEQGRWLSRDPIQENGGLHVYVYVLNAPTHYVDPFGLKIRACTEADKNKIKSKGISGMKNIMKNRSWGRPWPMSGKGGRAKERSIGGQIWIGTDQSEAEKYASLVHEFVGGIFSTWYQGSGEVDFDLPAGNAVYPDGSPVQFKGGVTGSHNLALAFEFAAFAQKGICSCSRVRERYQTAQCGKDGSKILWQDWPKDTMDFICNCEKNETGSSSMDRDICYYKEGIFDDEAFWITYSIKCTKGKISSGSVSFRFND